MKYPDSKKGLSQEDHQSQIDSVNSKIDKSPSSNKEEDSKEENKNI